MTETDTAVRLDKAVTNIAIELDALRYEDIAVPKSLTRAFISLRTRADEAIAVLNAARMTAELSPIAQAMIRPSKRSESITRILTGDDDRH